MATRWGQPNSTQSCGGSMLQAICGIETTKPTISKKKLVARQHHNTSSTISWRKNQCNSTPSQNQNQNKCSKLFQYLWQFIEWSLGWLQDGSSHHTNLFSSVCYLRCYQFRILHSCPRRLGTASKTLAGCLQLPSHWTKNGYEKLWKYFSTWRSTHPIHCACQAWQRASFPSVQKKRKATSTPTNLHKFTTIWA